MSNDNVQHAVILNILSAQPVSVRVAETDMKDTHAAQVEDDWAQNKDTVLFTSLRRLGYLLTDIVRMKDTVASLVKIKTCKYNLGVVQEGERDGVQWEGGE
ncbi:hypothetical protein EON64_18970 [archaeon]|nr:MAG: hypothetical protein EON64_18970 [archaeon]